MAANFTKLLELLRGSPPIRREVRRASHDSRRMSSWPPIPQKYRCNALSDVIGKFRTLAHSSMPGLFILAAVIDIA